MWEPQNPKIELPLEFPKFQKPKKPTPRFGFLETRAEASKPKNQKLLDFPKIQKSKNPKVPTQVWDFWELGREPQNPKTQNSSSFQKSKNPKNLPQGLGFWKLEREHEFWVLRLPLEFPKIRNLGWSFWILGNSRNFGFQKTHPKGLDFRKLEQEPQNPRIELPLEFPKTQKSKKPIPRFGFLETRAGARILDFEAPARVSKKSETWVGIFGILDLETRGVFGFWILRLPLEFPKIRNLGWNFWILGFLETRGILECWSSTPFLDRLEIQFRGLS